MRWLNLAETLPLPNPGLYRVILIAVTDSPRSEPDRPLKDEDTVMVGPEESIEEQVAPERRAIFPTTYSAFTSTDTHGGEATSDDTRAEWRAPRVSGMKRSPSPAFIESR